MTPEQLSQVVVGALRRLVDDGALVLPDGVPGEVTVERPRQPEHGDYATNVAMQLAKPAGMPPREVAALLQDQLSGAEGVAAVEVAGPGFLNVRVASGAQGRVATDVLAAGASYGRSEVLAGHRVNVEFVSANPTGPLHLGHTRWAVVGDAIARVLDAAGAEVTREFYLNDRGNQMDLFAASVEAAALGTAPPEDGYRGDYVAAIARAVVADDPGITDQAPDQRRTAFREAAYTRQLGEHREQLAEFRTHFDVWFSERSLHELADGADPAGGQDAVQHGLSVLRAAGHLYEADGAVWMRTTDFGDDKDRVLVRSDGELTYFASDTAYYVNKRERGFDRCLYLLGADHHGYVARLRAMAACAGDDPDEHLEVLIGQLVTIMRGGTEVKLSKRSGDIVTLAELVAEIGVDALRYSLARYPTDSPLTLDIEEITRASADNPVYYVQYAHARVSAILRNAADLGMPVPSEGPGGAGEVDPGLLSHEKEGELLRALADFPGVVATAAEFREPHRVARYLESTAADYHRFYDHCRVLPQGDEEPTPLHHARLALVAATRTVLAGGLDLLGVSAPERM